MEDKILKDLWKQSSLLMPSINKKEVNDIIMSRISGINKSIRKRLIFEISISLFIYLAFFFVWLFYREGIKPFMYKIVAVTVIGVLPLFFRIIKSIRVIGRVHHKNNIRMCVEKAISHLKRTILIYQGITFAVAAVLIFLFKNDNSFLELSKLLQLCIFIYLLLVAVVSFYAIQNLYGKHLKTLKYILNEYEELKNEKRF